MGVYEHKRMKRAPPVYSPYAAGRPAIAANETDWGTAIMATVAPARASACSSSLLLPPEQIDANNATVRFASLLFCCTMRTVRKS